VNALYLPLSAMPVSQQRYLVVQMIASDISSSDGGCWNKPAGHTTMPLPVMLQQEVLPEDRHRGSCFRKSPSRIAKVEISSHAAVGMAAAPFSLFEPAGPGQHFSRPHTSMMPTFIQVFFHHMASEYPYITCGQIMRQCSQHTLSPLLANCIAALAVP
jgi:hypothetical protein